MFADFPQGSVAQAVGFAALAELVAVGSSGAALVVGVWLFAPAWIAAWLVSREGGVACLTLFGVATSAMILIHAAWGLCLEAGARAASVRANWIQGLRFGLYACGWDLVTSPAGIAGSLLVRSPRGTRSLLRGALIAPRAAVDAYTEQYRCFGPRARRRGRQLSVVVVGSLVLVGAVAGLAFVVASILRDANF